MSTSPKRILFQIGYEEKGLNARAELFRRFGHEVISVSGNEAAKQALASIPNVDVFIVGDTAPERTRKEIVDWLKANFPNAKIVALIPPTSRRLPGVDYNIVSGDWDEWFSLLAATS
jgi:short-subunit dehydrogenase involved in D-alanine esterification of teichoic acids